MKKKLLISFSGGRTSAYMMWWLMNEWEDRADYEIVVVYANTGKEVEGTLDFINECATKWSIPIVWIESTCKDKDGVHISKKGWKVSHKLISFNTASRNGEPFEEMISILGIPTTGAPFCSPQLKKKAIISYMKSIGWKDYYTAISIRFDEKDRMAKGWRELNFVYPFISLIPTDKQMVNAWWSRQSFNLSISPDLGNCDNCWKKDIKTLTRNARNYPSTYNWWQKMTDNYGHLNPRQMSLRPPYNFYRGNMSPKDIFKISKLQDNQIDLFSRKEGFNSCSESCEAF